MVACVLRVSERRNRVCRWLLGITVQFFAECIAQLLRGMGLKVGIGLLAAQ